MFIASKTLTLIMINLILYMNKSMLRHLQSMYIYHLQLVSVLRVYTIQHHQPMDVIVTSFVYKHFDIYL